MPPSLLPLARSLPFVAVAAGAVAAALWLTVHPAAALPPSATTVNAPPTDTAAQAEFRRLVDYMAYAQAVQRFRALRSAGPATPELLALARQLDEELPQRLARQEMSEAAARELQAALHEVLAADLR